MWMDINGKWKILLAVVNKRLENYLLNQFRMGVLKRKSYLNYS